MNGDYGDVDRGRPTGSHVQRKNYVVNSDKKMLLELL